MLVEEDAEGAKRKYLAVVLVSSVLKLQWMSIASLLGSDHLKNRGNKLMSPRIWVVKFSLEPMGFKLNSLAFLRRAPLVNSNQSSWDLALSPGLNLGLDCNVEAIIISNFFEKYQQKSVLMKVVCSEQSHPRCGVP